MAFPFDWKMERVLVTIEGQSWEFETVSLARTAARRNEAFELKGTILTTPQVLFVDLR